MLTDRQVMELSRLEAAPWAERAQALALAQVERQLPLLGELAEIGLEVARAVERAAKVFTPASAPAKPAELPQAELAPSDRSESDSECDTAIDDAEPQMERASGVEGLALAYARVSRAVRLTIALQSKLVKDLEALHRRTDYRDGWKARQARDERKVAVGNAVMRIVYAETPDQERAESYFKAAQDWMESDRYADITERPMSEVLAQVCKDLKLDPDWPRLAEDAWARAEIASGNPGAPLKALLARPARADEPADDADDRFGRHQRWRARMRPSIRAGPV